MATDALKLGPRARAGGERRVAGGPLRVLAPLASLQLTVVLFALSMVIVLVGTLAQAQPGNNMWQVLEDYFRAWIAWIPFQVFLVPAFFPNAPELPPAAGFYFPGGALIGLAMGVNLLAAHLIRFRVQASGGRRLAGWLVTGLGVLFTTAVIMSGNSARGLQGEMFLTKFLPEKAAWDALWFVFLGVLGLIWSAFTYISLFSQGNRRVISVVINIVLTPVLTYLLYHGTSIRLNNEGMRILWQLMQGLFGSGFLLFGCWLLFRRRAGIVMLHGGLALMMAGVAWASYALEQRMVLFEGETSNFTRDLRSVELAVTLPDAGDGYEEMVIVPQSKLLASEQSKQRIKDPNLPFDLQVVKYLKNSDRALVTDRKVDDPKILVLAPKDNLADAGRGLRLGLVPARASSGADTDSEVDMPGAYVTLYEKDSDKSLGTYALGTQFSQAGQTEMVDADGKKYEVSVRFTREYKDFTVTLLDVRKDDYMGTSTPRNYSSEIWIASGDEHREHKIKMNDPLRFAGETFYQSGYIPLEDGSEATSLQVVRNTGWMIPYVSCVIISVGLSFHFGGVLLRFLSRREQQVAVAQAADDPLDQLPMPDRKRQKKERRKAIRHEPKVAYYDTGVRATVALAVVALALLYVGYRAQPPRYASSEINWNEVGKIPILFEGRVKPLDTLARNSLWVISDKSRFRPAVPWIGADLERAGADWKVTAVKPDSPAAEAELAEGDLVRKIGGRELSEADESYEDALAELTIGEQAALAVRRGGDDLELTVVVGAEASKRSRPPVEWLMDVLADRPIAEHHPIVRIDYDKVQQLLGLPRRKGFLYSISEIAPGIEKLQEQVEAAAKTVPEERDTFQKKVLEVERRMKRYIMLRNSFEEIDVPDLPIAEMRAGSREAQERVNNIIAALEQITRQVKQGQPPLAVPFGRQAAEAEDEEGEYIWHSYLEASVHAGLARQVEQDPPPFADGWLKMVRAYRGQDPAAFNSAVAAYHGLMREQTPPQVDLAKSQAEWHFNLISPFNTAAALYVLAFLLIVCSWGGAHRSLNGAAFWLLVATFVLHTFALVARIYISGRPPITNLYSSAVFIGWACVMFGLILELIYGMGIGNLLSSAIGFATLLIAHFLSTDGDTFKVLQAVLDTQFWLATHVVCISLGYSATFVAGGLAIIYLLAGLFTPLMRGEQGRHLRDLIYGTVCFALLFSFVGTVLGGLWADDSWGRFWGWDPKENGALLIVIWNALVLHARWAGMVRDRGFANLVIGGNIVTSWSWFGVNELGVGLHSYGFTEGVLFWLMVFNLSQLVVIGIGMFPRSIYQSFRAEPSELAA